MNKIHQLVLFAAALAMLFYSPVLLAEKSSIGYATLAVGLIIIAAFVLKSRKKNQAKAAAREYPLYISENKVIKLFEKLKQTQKADKIQVTVSYNYLLGIDQAKQDITTFLGNYPGRTLQANTWFFTTDDLGKVAEIFGYMRKVKADQKNYIPTISLKTDYLEVFSQPNGLVTVSSDKPLEEVNQLINSL